MAIERITIEPGNMGGQPCIRGLPIKFWDLYRDLALHGMTEDEVLQKYPELEPDDLAAVREFAANLIKDGREIDAVSEVLHFVGIQVVRPAVAVRHLEERVGVVRHLLADQVTG